jgi:hypothetical protein
MLRGLSAATWDALAPRRGANSCGCEPPTRQPIVWETVISGRGVESLPILQEAIYGMESRLGLLGDDADTRKKRGRTEIRLDSGWGSGPNITWLLERGYQMTGKFKSAGHVRKLVRGNSTWQPTSSPGREVPEPVMYVRLLAQSPSGLPPRNTKKATTTP